MVMESRKPYPNNLRNFLIRVNEDFIYRAEFLKDPVRIIEELLGVTLSHEKKEQILELRKKLMTATGGVFNLPTDPATANLLEHLREGSVKIMGDDCIIL